MDPYHMCDRSQRPTNPDRKNPTMTYSSGNTFENEKGEWFAQWRFDEEGHAVGPFATEEEAEAVFLADDAL